MKAPNFGPLYLGSSGSLFFNKSLSSYKVVGIIIFFNIFKKFLIQFKLIVTLYWIFFGTIFISIFSNFQFSKFFVYNLKKSTEIHRQKSAKPQNKFKKYLIEFFRFWTFEMSKIGKKRNELFFNLFCVCILLQRVVKNMGIFFLVFTT